MQRATNWSEWLVPLAFVVCAGWLVWHVPAFTLDWYPPDSSQADNLRGLHHRNDVTPGMAGPFGMIRAHDMRDWHQRQTVCPPHPSHGAPSQVQRQALPP